MPPPRLAARALKDGAKTSSGTPVLDQQAMVSAWTFESVQPDRTVPRSAS